MTDETRQSGQNGQGVVARPKLTQERVLEWIELTDTYFKNEDICREVGIESYGAREHLRKILRRLEEKGVIRAHGRNTWRRADCSLEAVNWEDADPNATVDLVFPMGLDAYCKLYPQAIVVVAGAKNTGKTAFLLNTVRNNMDHPLGVDLFNSESSPEQLKQRFAPLKVPRPAPFRVFQRSFGFADVIDPDRISVIDYMELPPDGAYKVSEEMTQIFRKLRKGVAIIGLQKPPGRDLAYGAAFSAFRAQFYISLDANKCKIIYVKTPRDSREQADNKQWTFKLENGIEFKNVKESYAPIPEVYR